MSELSDRFNKNCIASAILLMGKTDNPEKKAKKLLSLVGEANALDALNGDAHKSPELITALSRGFDLLLKTDDGKTLDPKCHDPVRAWIPENEGTMRPLPQKKTLPKSIP